jgi:hypothetical protein
MTTGARNDSSNDLARRLYLRPIALAIALSLIGELGIWIVWGVILFPHGDPLAKLTWLAICGLGMGSVIGALTVLFVVGRLAGLRGGLAAGCLAFAVFVACDVLCWRLDHHYNFWGTEQNPALFLVNGVVCGGVAAILYGWLLFSTRGGELTDRLRL